MVELSERIPEFAGEVYYGLGSPYIYSFEGIGGLQNSKNGVVSKYRPTYDPTRIITKWSPWGDDNLFPQNVDSDVRKNGIVSRALEILIQTHFGKGFYTYKEEITEGGKVIKKIIRYPAFEEFARNTNLTRFMMQCINDYAWFRNIFPELIMSKDTKQIALAKRHDPMHCRWEKADEFGEIKNLYTSAEWPAPKENYYKTIPALNVHFPLLDLKNRAMNGTIKPGDSFILPIRINNGGGIYYDKSPWDAIRSQWLPVATNIPKMKRALLENQMVIKYHIKVPYSYWERKYGSEWHGWTKAVQNKLINEWRENMDEKLRGMEQAGKTIVSHYGRDEMTGKIFDELIIESIDDKIGDKKWIIDSAAANSENLFAVGVDPTILGQSSPGGSEAGSGSNKREAFSILQALMGLPRSIVFTPLEFIRDFNGWDPDLRFGHVDLDTSQTLDQNPTGKQTKLS